MLKFNKAFLAWMEAGICETKKEEIKRDFNTNGLFLDNFCGLTLLFAWKIKKKEFDRHSFKTFSYIAAIYAMDQEIIMKAK